MPPTASGVPTRGGECERQCALAEDLPQAGQPFGGDMDLGLHDLVAVRLRPVPIDVRQVSAVEPFLIGQPQTPPCRHTSSQSTSVLGVPR